MNADQIKELGAKIRENISKVIVGKENVIDLAITALFCSGHVLLEDVPGMGKTVLAKCLAKSINCDFKRIQFTPDLLPSDLTGINYYNQKQGEFVFREGPVFTNIILADEINRATPRTQSSLLECMEERQVTVDGETKLLSRPFFVIATQNPVEIQGTFPLPEAQLDRFFMRLKIGYPTAEEGRSILDRFQKANPLPSITNVTNAAEIVEAQDSIALIEVSDDLKNYIIQIVEMTRAHEKIILGISPRGSIALMRSAQAYAVINGRDFVTPDDVKHVAPAVLSHRIVLKSHAITSGADNAENVITDILNKVPVPLED
ncbi:MAG TPA: MoxR family ATPase [Clostridiales bacterium]|nr:MoxR family ATPase [Clostridiales bacterium]